MNKPLYMVIAALTAISLSYCPAQGSGTVYQDKTNGYSLELPDGWQSKADPIVTMVATPRAQIQADNPFPNIKVVARPMPGGHTLDSLCDTSIKQWGGVWKVRSDKHVTVGKLITRRLELEQTIPIANQKTKVLKAFASGKDNYYIISCADKPLDFEQSKKMFEAVLDSLKLQ